MPITKSQLGIPTVNTAARSIVEALLDGADVPAARVEGDPLQATK